MFYIFKKRKTTTPGAMNYSFQPNFTLPAQSPIGPAVAVKRIRAVFQPPQVMAAITVPTSGLGGLVAGQIIFQQLNTNGQ